MAAQNHSVIVIPTLQIGIHNKNPPQCVSQDMTCKQNNVYKDTSTEFETLTCMLQYVMHGFIPGVSLCRDTFSANTCPVPGVFSAVKRAFPQPSLLQETGRCYVLPFGDNVSSNSAGDLKSQCLSLIPSTPAFLQGAMVWPPINWMPAFTWSVTPH